MHIGDGAPPRQLDVAITGDRITFVGNAERAAVSATDTLDVSGLMVTPGFIDMHSHAVLTREYGRDAREFLYQGITTVAIGVDGGGTVRVADLLADLAGGGIGVNAFTYVGHGAVRETVIGVEDRAPTTRELERMRTLVRNGMDEEAFGL